jgi:site-specific recombinase XerD
MHSCNRQKDQDVAFAGERRHESRAGDAQEKNRASYHPPHHSDPGTIEGRTAALRFLFIKTLRRSYLPDHIPFPKRQRRLPTILDQQEVARLIDSAGNLMHGAMLMMLHATGLRRAEMAT